MAMRLVRGFVAFWYDFLIGDDWTMAAGVVVALGLTALMAHNGVVAWWLTPTVTVAVLATSLLREAIRQRSDTSRHYD